MEPAFGDQPTLAIILHLPAFSGISSTAIQE